MPDLVTPTTTIDKRCMFPLYGIPVGAGTALSNLTKAIYDLGCMILLAYKGYKLPGDQKLSANYIQAKQNIRQHMTFFALGILRMVPFAGGALSWAYNARRANQLMNSTLKAKDLDQNQKINLYQKVIELNGSTKAMLNIGLIYKNVDLSEEQNKEFKKLAFEWVQFASQKNDLEAMETLGEFYDEGIGTEKDSFKSSTYYFLAADKGYPSAQNILGLRMLEREGLGYTVDPLNQKVNQNLDREGVSWLQKAADQGHGYANYNLGMSYLEGRNGLEVSSTKAFEHFSKGAKAQNADCYVELAKMYLAGKGVDENGRIIPKGSVEAQELAYVNYTKGAELDNGEAHYFLALNYSKNEDETIRKQKSFYHCQKAAQLDFPEAPFKLGQMFLEGQGYSDSGESIPTNSALANKLAFAWIKKAANEDISEAQIKLSGLYLEGKGIDDSGKIIPQGSKSAHKLAFSWMEKVAKTDNETVQFQFGQMFLKGQGFDETGASVPSNSIKACQLASPWIEKVAKKGNPIAELQYGLILMHTDELNAGQWFRKAMNNPQTKQADRVAAKFRLGVCHMNESDRTGFRLIEEAAADKHQPAIDMMNSSSYKEKRSNFIGHARFR